MDIRAYRDEDEQAVLTLVGDLQDHESLVYDRMKPRAEIGRWYIDILKELSAKEDGAILVAEFDGRVAGYATVFTRTENRESFDEVPFVYAYVGDLVVAPDRRGQGIGKALLAHCEELAKAAGRKWLRIGVLAGNGGAHRAYRKFGFGDHLVIMEKPLT